MNARVSQLSWSRAIPGAAIIAMTAVLLALAALVAAPSWVSAQTAPTCAEQMGEFDPMYPIVFSGVTTETLAGPEITSGQYLCIEASGPFSALFKGTSEYRLNGNVFNLQVVGKDQFQSIDGTDRALILVTGGSVETRVSMPPQSASIEVDVFVGQPRPSVLPSPVAQPLPPAKPVAWIAVQLPANYGLGDKAEWNLKPISGTTTLNLSSKVPVVINTPNGPVTPTMSLSGWYDFSEKVIEGTYSVPALTARAGLWSARLTGSPGAILRMKAAAPAPTTSVAGKTNVWKSAAGNYFLNADCSGGAVVFDPARHNHVGGCSGGRGRIAGAPAPMRFPNLPLLLIK